MSENKPAIKQMLVILILCAIYIPVTARQDYYNVIKYGARKDGNGLSTKAIQSAIDDCASSGGGTVWFPAGTYLSGTICLKSHVTLYLDAGALISGSKDLKDYPVTISIVRSYTDNYTNKSLIYAEGLEDIAITGQGVIDGNGSSFKVGNIENDDSLRKKDEFWFYKSRPYMIRIINCKKILVRDITLKNSPMWVQHYLLCEDLNIDGITVNSRVNHNNDGIDIDGCMRVRIANCNIISGDDAIVLKSTLDKPCKNVTITNCILSSNCNAFKLGTETNAGFEDIVFSNSTIYDTHLAGITLQIVDGGSLERVSVSNITMNNVGDAIFIRLGNRARPYTGNMAKPGMGRLSHVIMDNIQGNNIGKTGCSITGLPGFMVNDITLSNICLTFEGGGKAGLSANEVPEVPEAYPEHDMFGELPAYGFYCRHCKNIRFNNIELGFDTIEARPAIVLDDVEDVHLKVIKASVEVSAPVICFNAVKNALIQSCRTIRGTNTFLQLNGFENQHITLTGNDLSYAKTAVSGANSSALFLSANRMPPLYGLSDGLYVNCGLQYTDDREIRLNTPAGVRKKQVDIIRAIWGTDRMPERSDVVVTPNIKSPLSPNSSVARVDRFEIPVEAEIKAGTEPVKDLAYFFIPVKRNNRLVLLNPGHSCKLTSPPDSDNRIEQTVTGLLQSGFDVLAVFMPHVSEEGCNLDHCSVINTGLGPGDHPATYGLRFFLEPEIVSLNYLMLKNNYADINMVGLSGGGWTTNLLASIDNRIRYSFSVAGSMPLYYRSDPSMGDIEQFLPALYRDIAGYPDLYVLGAFGKGRKQIQILNRRDDCCFGQKQHDPERNYDKDLKTFETSVKEKLRALGADGHYYLVIDETAPGHQISAFTLKNVILKELNGK
jgi:polygalacturonase